MLTEFAHPITYSKQGRANDISPSSAISRLVAAAVVNKNFRDLLLTDPGQALAQGYQGETFNLNDKERNLILSIQANNLSEFALQITSDQEDRTLPGGREWISVKQNALTLEPG